MFFFALQLSKLVGIVVVHGVQLHCNDQLFDFHDFFTTHVSCRLWFCYIAVNVVVTIALSCSWFASHLFFAAGVLVRDRSEHEQE